MLDKKPRITSLDGIVESISAQHKYKLRPVSSRIKIRAQGVLPFMGIESTGSFRAVAMGRFYEYLTAAFYGGRLGSVIKLDDSTNSNGGNGDGEVQEAEEQFDITTILKPDVVHSEANVMYESKAVRSGQTCKLTDSQIDLYKELQQRNPYPKVYFVIYRHGLYGIKSTWTGSAEKLFGVLSERTAYSLVLPFRMILRLHDTENPSEYVSRYEGKENSRDDFNTCTCIRASALTRILKEPERVLQDLNHPESSFLPEEFRVRRFMSPNKIYVNRNRVRQFPIVYITDRVAEAEMQGHEELDVPF